MRPSQVRVIDVPHTAANGPLWARALAHSLWEGEGFVLNIDSHMRFVHHWDTSLLEQWHAAAQHKRERCGSSHSDDSSIDRVVLTTYPPGYQLPNALPQSAHATVMCAHRFGDDGLLRFAGALCL